MANTRIPGTIIRSGSIPTVALSGGVVSSSVQVISALPGDTVSSSAQVTNLLPNGTVSHSAQIVAALPTNTVSHSAQVVAFLPTGTVSSSTQYPGWVTSSTQVDYLQLQNIPTGIASSSVQVTAYLPTGTVSSSGQIDITNTTNYTSFSSSFAAVDTIQTSRLNAIENVTGSYATTGSNTFVSAQTISDTTNSTSYLDGALHVAGGMSVRKDVRVSGSLTVNGLLTAVSMSTQYVTASEYNVGVSKITLNDDDTVRFAGISIYDSGSSSPTSASIYWDSLQHRFIYENLSGSAYNSSIIIAGPKHTGSLGDEPTLTSGYLPYATGTDHIDNSVMFQSSSRIGIGTTNPTVNLDIENGSGWAGLDLNGTSGGEIRLQKNGTTYGQLYASEGGSTGFVINAAGAGNDIYFQNAGTTTMTILDTGNLLVGGTSTAAGGLVQIQSSSNTIISVRSTNGAGTAPGIRFFHDTNDEFVIRGGDGLRFFGSGVNERMVITGAGNVGINSTTPGYRLDISGSGDIQQRINSSGTDAGLMMAGSRNYVIYSGKAGSGIGTGNFSIYDATAGLARLTISGSGNVGIGTTNPSEALHVYSTGTSPRPALFLETTNASATPEVRLFQTSGRAILMNLQTNGDWAFQTSANNSTFTERVRINASGSVGIGVSVPRATLHVGNPTAGTPAIPAAGQSGSYSSVYVTSNAPGYGLLIGSLYSGNTWMQVQRTDGTAEVYNLILQPNGGSVGIGTISPSTKLEVSGSIRGDAYLGRNYTSYTYSSGTLTLNTVTTSGPAVFNYVIKVNPNSGGSSLYTDFLYGKIIIGTGWNGSAVTDFINIMHENPTPRSLYNSGGGNLSVDAVFFTSSELTSLAAGTSYTLRLKISGFSADPNGITALISQIG